MLRPDKRYLLLTLLICSTVYLVTKMAPPKIEPIFKVVVTKQQGNIPNLDAPRKPEFTRLVFIDVIDFAAGQELSHRNFGSMGLKEDFFLDIYGTFNVVVDGDYEFIVSSDDGFRLTIDDNIVSEFPNNRSLASTRVVKRLATGEHRLHLAYYQGFGPLALRATYRRLGVTQAKVLGDTSSDIVFLRANTKEPGLEKEPKL